MSLQDDSFRLSRFVEAQEAVYKEVRSELRTGRKQGHWMWFIFPQMRGLDFSIMATTYAIASREEARAYYEHPVLGPRLIECTKLLNALNGKTITSILGSPDDVKFQSCMTLFNLAAPENPVFRNALRKYFRGESDERTISIL